jgi:hypothetical protein
MTALDNLQEEHRKNLARKGIDAAPEEPSTTFHCRRCHRELPIAEYAKHYKSCPGFTSKCYDTCPATGEPVDHSRKSPPEAPGHA